MDKDTQISFENLESPDQSIRYQAFLAIQALTSQKVDWTYEVWGLYGK